VLVRRLHDILALHREGEQVTKQTSEVGGSESEVARNRTFGAGIVDDPYPTMRELRSVCPVHSGSLADHYPGMEDLRPLVPTGVDTFSTYSYQSALDVLRRPDEFASEPFYAQLSASIGPSVIGMDEPEHRRMRLLVQPAFAKREMEVWKERIIGPIVDEHFDRIAPLGRADIYQEIGATVPVQTIAAAIGLPGEDRERFFEWAVTMTLPTASAEHRAAASKALGDYLQPAIAARRAEPRDDVLSSLGAATVPEDSGEDVDLRPLSDEEISSFVRIFIIAGAGTTFRGYGSLMYHLLMHREQLEEVRADRTLIPNAIDEALRIEQPLAFIGRMTTSACELAGVTVPTNSYIETSVSAANHDPAQFPDPERFDIHREKADRHLAFGFGIHRCVGAHLATAELSVMLEQTLDRLPNLRLDPAATDVHMTGLGLRMVSKLPVLYDATRG
jgi:cytochrome P450